MALKIIHVMEFQILFAQIFFYKLVISFLINICSSRKRQPIDFILWIRLLGRFGMGDINQSTAPYGLVSWISLQHLA